MKIGEMRDRITIQSFVKEDNPYDEGDWEHYYDCWAKEEFLNGKEFWSAKATNSENTVRYIIRYTKITKNITTSMRVKNGENVYEIIAPPRPFSNKKFLIILCKEVNVSG